MTKMPTPNTAAEALELAFVHGKALQTPDVVTFPALLGEHVNIDHSTSQFLPYLRIGFAAGFFGLPKPNFERIANRCATEAKRASKRHAALEKPILQER